MSFRESYKQFKNILSFLKIIFFTKWNTDDLLILKYEYMQNTNITIYVKIYVKKCVYRYIFSIFFKN